eukprot:CAMPEP_0116940462 /NCGR_PEP_ID=MMETSP0467-20121206/33383_1 /TAXON_ID=283647 /ORGANISM="Mesodinium pulex, Strain SPMC105" /LENGTH=120 /DNA_ID=CAMNT_0004623011 /DNA_START=35 /DNA_END=397 /DNA_ORIENTATION=-
MSIPEKWRVSDDDQAISEQEPMDFNVDEFKEKVMERTTEFDRKNFPAENWANHCWQMYNIYVLCAKKNDGDDDKCVRQKFNAYTNCPHMWTDQWDEEREKGTFLGVQVSNPWKKNDDHHH